ncbi:MAG TPA: hypothetical protein PKH39_20040 [Woeseiaceae bacterium]|nr:hypothetical protein [Woeseiaceae bacterium]
MLQFLPLVVAILPLAGVTAAYWLNINAGVLPACLPFLDGCTSISATGRYLPGSMPFRAALLPQAALLGVMWWISVEWLQRHYSTRSRLRGLVLVTGVVGALALIVYVTFLGTNHPVYEFMRRFGIYFYFLGTALAQLLLTLCIERSRLRQVMLAIVLMPFVLGIANLFLKPVLVDPDGFENAIEWVAAFLMQCWFALLFVAWRRTGLIVRVETDSTNVHS